MLCPGETILCVGPFLKIVFILVVSLPWVFPPENFFPGAVFEEIFVVKPLFSPWRHQPESIEFGVWRRCRCSLFSAFPARGKLCFLSEKMAYKTASCLGYTCCAGVPGNAGALAVMGFFLRRHTGDGLSGLDFHPPSAG